MLSTVLGRLVQAVASAHQQSQAPGRPPLLDMFEHLLKERQYQAVPSTGLTRGTIVIANRNIYSPEGAIALKGESGVVFELGAENVGPTVRWDSGGVSTIAIGDVITYS